MGFKRTLKAVVNWMDRKYPDKVVVTTEEYNKLKSQVGNITEERIKAIEVEINKFNVSLGFGGTVSQKLAPFSR